MDDVTKADVTEFASELAGSAVSDGAWVRILAYVNEHELQQTGETEGTAALARIYLAAHIAKVGALGVSTAAGPVTSESAGGIRRAYANLSTATSLSSLKTTRYGQLYLDLLSSSLASGPFLV